jgi:hypothetical protein
VERREGDVLRLRLRLERFDQVREREADHGITIDHASTQRIR